MHVRMYDDEEEKMATFIADRQTDRQGRHFCRGGTSAGEALTAAYPQPPQVCSRTPLYGAVYGLSSVWSGNYVRGGARGAQLSIGFSVRYQGELLWI